ncbi:MAG: GTPase domain-containing protein [Planctomycetota bacterium]|nr:GTPase domain-containing protein [Planctomycetota bacterium]
MTEPPVAGVAGDAAAITDFADFDELVESLGRWADSGPDWPPARRIRAEWEQVAPRLDRTRRELSRMLVVGVIGGTGTGKSTLVNALAGSEVTTASDVARPTTTAPIVVVADDVDCGWLPIDAMQGRLVRSGSPAVANIVLIDCPDPDTQADEPSTTTPHAPRPSDANRNRDMLAAVLPACDVLLLVATAQKYRSWIVARELQAFAPGRPLLFVQTHASRDPDIREDWRRELESQGFAVPRIFRLDALEAAQRAAAGLAAEPGFQELLTAIDEELVGRAARRVRRTGALDLTGWFVGQAQSQLGPLREPVAGLAAGVARERTRLEGILAAAIESKLQTNRTAWQRLLTDEVVDRWHGGPFAMFLHTVAAIGSFWTRLRPGGGLIGQLLAGHAPEYVAGRGSWQAVEELGLSEADVEQSRSILAGLAGRAKIAEPLVGRARLDDTQAGETVGTLLERTGRWLASGIERLVSARRGRVDGPLLRWTFEILFTSLIVIVLGRAGWNYFYGHLWEGRRVDGSGFLQESFVWIILWGLVLRWLLFAWVRLGLHRDITALTERLPPARLIDPLINDFATAAEATQGYLKAGDQFAGDVRSLTARLDDSASGLGRMRP